MKKVYLINNLTKNKKLINIEFFYFLLHRN